MTLTMTNVLTNIDQQVLLAINGWHSDWADGLMWIISRSVTWIPLYVVLVGLLIWRYGRGRWYWALVAVAAIAAAAGLADFISSGVIKHLVCRPRPTHEPSIANLLHIVNGYRGGLYGFVSSHAANTMAVTLTFSLIWRDLMRQRVARGEGGTWYRLVGLLLGFWCAANCYSRMYLGVHYPGDILGGLLVGGLVGLGMFRLWRRLAAVWDPELKAYS